LNNNSDKFLDAFNGIERYLRRISGSDKQIPFYQLIEYASKSDAAVRSLRVDLQEYADLRNAIIHERTDGHVIAEPNLEAVEKIERMQALITKPPTIREFMSTSIISFRVNDSIGTAVKDMYDKDYSQAPVYDGNQFIGLLTTNTIARWLGANVAEDIFSLTETSIGKVLEYTEDPNNVVSKKPDTSAYDVLDLIQKHEAQGKHLDAILVTHSGIPSERLLGIVTIWDFHNIHYALDISGR
jgi:predicted transcriptional regulator